MDIKSKHKRSELDVAKSVWADQELSALRPLCEDVVARALQRGATAAEIGASIHGGLAASVRMGEVETLEYSRDRGLAITVYFGQRKGSASSGDLSSASIEASLDMACAIAKYTEPDVCSGLADATRMAREFHDLDLWHPWDLDADHAIDLAMQCESAALNSDPRISNSEGASVHTGLSLAVYANSHGFLGARRSTRQSVSCVVLAKDEAGMQRDYWYDTRRAASDLENVASIGRQAARRALGRLGAKSLSTRRVPVILVPEVARGFVRHLVSAVSGGSLYRRASFLIDHAGQQVFSPLVTLTELPFERRGLQSTDYDGEGVATSERKLVDAGVLTGYVLGSYSARKLGLQSTGNSGGVHNLTVTPGCHSADELLQQMGRGFLVTEVMGQGVSIVTGDYSRGATGFWVEDGRISHAVEGVTIAANLKEMFRGVVALGNDVDDRGGIRAPSIMIEQMTVAGQ